MTMQLRRLTPDDAAAAYALASLAFGYRERPMPPEFAVERDGRRHWGAFDGAGRLLAKAVDRQQGHWFGGRLVPASGVAGVAVAADQRRGGLARRVLTRLLGDARGRGAVISTLFPTTPFVYRSLGWEEVGALVATAVPASAFAGLRPPAGTVLRPASPADVPAIRELYREYARQGNGMMERSGPGLDQDPDGFLGGWHGVTVAVGADGVTGYSTWDRGPGYDASGRLMVGELLGRDRDATVALLSMLGGWASVAPTIVLRQPAVDPAFLFTDAGFHGEVQSRRPWMLRVVDVPAALSARGFSPHLRGTVSFAVTDPECPWNTGAYRLTFADGGVSVSAADEAPVRFTPRGLALWYAGAATPPSLRRAGLLDGDPAADGLLAAATAGPPPTLLDYF